MHWNNMTLDEIQSHRQTHNSIKHIQDILSKSIGVEDPLWHDGVCYYKDKEGNRYSTRGFKLIEKDELCRYGFIYKVQKIIDGPGKYEYHYKILSQRLDDAE